MSRCAEFYEKWERFPNWCEKTKGAVSRINAYLANVQVLEDMGVDKVLTFGNLTEGTTRCMNTWPEERRREVLTKIAEVLKKEALTKKEQRAGIEDAINDTSHKLILEQLRATQEERFNEQRERWAKAKLADEAPVKIDETTTVEGWRRSMLELAYYELEPVDLWDDELKEERPEWAVVAELALHLLSDILNDIDTLSGYGGNSRLQAYAARLLGEATL